MQAKFLDDAVEDDRQIKPLTLVCESRADITWYRIPNTEWGDDDPSARIGEAVRWYNRYCIHLTFDEFSLNPNNPQEQRIRDEINRLVPEYNARVARIPRARGALERLLNDAHSSVLEKTSLALEACLQTLNQFLQRRSEYAELRGELREAFSQALNGQMTMSQWLSQAANQMQQKITPLTEDVQKSIAQVVQNMGNHLQTNVTEGDAQPSENVPIHGSTPPLQRLRERNVLVFPH
jgi:hypothetical protein